MRLTGSRAYTRPTPTPKMPAGLVELMEGLTKDVLKNNPDDIYEFCAGHMQKLIDIRDGNLPKKQKMTLEDKIKRAQEKVRQKIQERLLQYDDKSKPDNEKANKTNTFLDTEEKNVVAPVTDPDAVISTEDTNISKQPVPREEISNVLEADTLYEPNVTVAPVNDTTEEFMKPHESSRIYTENESVNVENEVVKESRETCGGNKDLPMIPDTESKETCGGNKDSLIIPDTDSKETCGGNKDSPVIPDTESKETCGGNKDSPIISDKESKETCGGNKDSPVISDTESKEICGGNKDSPVIPDTESKETCGGNKDSPITPDTLHIEESNKQIDTNGKDGMGYSGIKDVPIILMFTSESLCHEYLTQIDEDDKEKLSEMDVKPISSELSVENTVNEIKETTTVQSKSLPEMEHVVSDYSNEDKMTQNTDDVISASPIQRDASNLKDSLENHNEPEVDMAKEESKGTEEILPTETERVENVKNVTKENIELQIVHEALKFESVLEDIVMKGDHDKDDEKKVEDVKFSEHTTKVESEIKSSAASTDNIMKYDPKETKEDKENNDDESREGIRLESKSDEIDSSSSIDYSEKSTKNDTPCQGIRENVDINTKEKENVELLKSAPSSESDENKNELSILEGNVDTAREFLEHDRQFSTELAKEEVISENSTIENNIMEQSDATIETNPSVTGMDLETAAVTIQKVFRSFLFSKSRTSTLDDGVNENSLDDDIDKKVEMEFISGGNMNKERRALGISRMDTVLQTVNEEKSLSLSTDDSSTLSSAATTIQAHVRGFLARARLASHAASAASTASDGPSTVSLDGESSQPKKTILNIHILPERGQFMSRDESILTSIDLPLDNSPPSSVNLHPLGYDKSEPRKQLKREDAIQSVSPPSNNSGKLSEEVDSMKENENNIDLKPESNTISSQMTDQRQEDAESCDTTLTISSTADTVVDAEVYNIRELSSPEHISDVDIKNKEEAVANLSSDEMDVVTPLSNAEKNTSSPDIDSNEKPKLIHSGEFHDMVVQTQVKRSETSVVREFKNVLVYFLLWDKT